jgi:carbamoyl-phosphate synthase large subunit
MKEIIVGVSGINAVDNPGPGVGIARSLKENTELKVKVMGLAYDAMEPGIYMDWLIDKAFITPYPSGSHTEFLQRLYHIKDTYGLDLIIPNLDAELPLYIRYSSNLEKKGIKTFLPTATSFACGVKTACRKWRRISGSNSRNPLLLPPTMNLGKQWIN